MTTRAELERKLWSAATAAGLRGELRRAFVATPLDAAFPRKRATPRKKPALLRTQANPRKKRKKNPVQAHASARQMNVIKAIQLFERFHLGEPRFVDEMNFNFHREQLLIGRCVAIEYDTRRKGKAERYRHEFSGKSRPILASSYDGAQLYFLGGAYDFTERGIVDR
jgi:hypothetical protein